MTHQSRLPRAGVLLWLLLLLGFATLAHAADQKSFDPMAETEKYLSTLPAEARAKSDAYFEGGYLFQVWDLVLLLLITWGLLKSRVTVKLRDFAERFFKARYLQGLLFIALFMVVN